MRTTKEETDRFVGQTNQNISLENIPQKLEYKMMVGYKQIYPTIIGIFINYLSKIVIL